MAYNARVYRIFIASPSDVEEEREVIAKVIREWNDLHSFERKVVLLPLRWETHSAPELGKRPQDIINSEIVDSADMAVGVFWTRIGTPTGEYASGTIEEIERLGLAGKTVMCYFSKAKAELDNLDLDQYKLLKEFKKRTYPNGLIESYSNIIEFRDKFSKQLEIKIRTLISNDRNSEVNSADTRPNIEFELIDPISKSPVGDEYTAKPRIVKFTKEAYELIPDYVRHIVKSDTISWGENSQYYKEYFDYVRKSWSLIPIQFLLKNISSIAVRDVYIEMTCTKNPDFKLSNQRPSKPEKSSLVFSTGYDSLNNKEVTFSETSKAYKIQLAYSALQPQRGINIEQPLFITGTKKETIELSLKIYADCFAMPLNRTLKITIDPEEIDKNPVDILEELGIFEKTPDSILPN